MKADIEINRNGTAARIALDGHDVSRACRAVRVYSEVGRPTTVELDLAVVETISFRDESVQVRISESVRDALIAVGWTPPEEPPR